MEYSDSLSQVPGHSGGGEHFNFGVDRIVKIQIQRQQRACLIRIPDMIQQQTAKNRNGSKLGRKTNARHQLIFNSGPAAVLRTGTEKFEPVCGNA